MVGPPLGGGGSSRRYLGKVPICSSNIDKISGKATVEDYTSWDTSRLANIPGVTSHIGGGGVNGGRDWDWVLPGGPGGALGAGGPVGVLGGGMYLCKTAAWS